MKADTKAMMIGGGILAALYLARNYFLPAVSGAVSTAYNAATNTIVPPAWQESVANATIPATSYQLAVAQAFKDAQYWAASTGNVGPTSFKVPDRTVYAGDGIGGGDPVLWLVWPFPEAAVIYNVYLSGWGM